MPKLQLIFGSATGSRGATGEDWMIAVLVIA